MKPQYTRVHVVAVALCLTGIAVLVASDVQRDRHGSWDSPAGASAALYGDVLCLLGSAVYACSNVGQEYLVKKKDRRVREGGTSPVWMGVHVNIQVALVQLEFLGMLGGCGFAISVVQGAVLEGRALEAIQWCVRSLSVGLRRVVTSIHPPTHTRAVRTVPSALCLAGYVGTLFLMYTCTSVRHWSLLLLLPSDFVVQ